MDMKMIRKKRRQVLQNLDKMFSFLVIILLLLDISWAASVFKRSSSIVNRIGLSANENISPSVIIGSTSNNNSNFSNKKRRLKRASSSSSTFRTNKNQNQHGVTLNGRKKEHGEPEVCPNLTYCKCRVRGMALDVTCERINSYNLKVDTDILKQREHFVRYFNIRNSDIPKLEDYIFMGIKIEHLYIHNSNIRSLGPNSLSSQGAVLSHLVLSRNNLKDVPTEAIKMLRNLDHLNLNENNITVIHKEAFLGLSKVTRLTIYNNQIHKIDPNAFDGLLRDLIRLNLGKNHLEAIPHSAVVPLKYLKTLDFTDNRISNIEPGDFEGMDNLDTLVLNTNKLIHIGEDAFKGLSELTTLYMDHNKISSIHHNAFVGLEPHLTSLTLTGNLLEAFPSESLRPIHRLETLHIDDNRIPLIEEDAFSGFGEHIRFMWLQNNLIRNIPAPAFQDLHSLEWIKLYNNDLKTLTYELMEPVLDTLMHIDIHSNPLVCDCDLRWYRQWIEEEWNEVDDEWLQDTFCLDVADKKEHNIAEVPLKDMFCNDDVSDKPPSVKDDDGGALTLSQSYFCSFLLPISISIWAMRSH